MMQQQAFYTDPFFWALLSMLGIVAATSVFSRQKFRHSGVFVAVALTLVTVGRIVLVLPFCPQPRFDVQGMQWVIGGAVLLLAAAVAAGPLVVVRWWAPPVAGMQLRNTGIYDVIRHPIYLAELLWSLGWAVLFRSTYGVAFTALWWASFLIHALAEEADLERALGQEYRDYMQKVRGRFLPGLPF